MKFKEWLVENSAFDHEYISPPDEYTPQPSAPIYDPNDPWSIKPASSSKTNAYSAITNPDPKNNKPREFTGYAFIFTDDFQLFLDRNGEHYRLIGRTPELMKKFNLEDLSVMQIDQIWQNATKSALLGRLGVMNNPEDEKVKRVSFWNTDQYLLEKLLRPCFDQLEQKGLIDKNVDYFNTMHNQAMPIKNLFNGLRFGSTQKTGNGGKPHPMATAMQNAGLLKPGQKWWAPTSENSVCNH